MKKAQGQLLQTPPVVVKGIYFHCFKSFAAFHLWRLFDLSL